VLLIFLLKGARPNKYRDNVRQEIAGPGGAAVTHKVVLERVDVPAASLEQCSSRRMPFLGV